MADSQVNLLIRVLAETPGVKNLERIRDEMLSFHHIMGKVSESVGEVGQRAFKYWYASQKAAIRATSEASGEMGRQMRWIGRDIMKIGRALGSVAGMFGKYFQQMVRQSGSLAEISEDIGFAQERMAETLGDAVAPVLKWVSSIMERFADLLERLPRPFQTALGFFIVLGYVGLKVLSSLMALVGFMLLLTYSLKGIAKEAGIVTGRFWLLTTPFKLLYYLMTGNLAKQRELMEAQRIHDYVLEKLKIRLLEQSVGYEQLSVAIAKATKASELRNIVLKHSLGLTTQERATLLNEIKMLSTLEAGIEATRKASAGQAEALGEGAQESKRLHKTVKKAGKGIGQAGIGFMLMGGAFMLMIPLLEAMEPLWEALSAVMEPVGEVLSSVTEFLAEQIEEHPELASALAGVIVALVTGNVQLGAFISTLGSLGKALSGGTASLDTFLSISQLLPIAASEEAASFILLSNAVSSFSSLVSPLLEVAIKLAGVVGAWGIAIADVTEKGRELAKDFTDLLIKLGLITVATGATAGATSGLAGASGVATLSLTILGKVLLNLIPIVGAVSFGILGLTVESNLLGGAFIGASGACAGMAAVLLGATGPVGLLVAGIVMATLTIIRWRDEIWSALTTVGGKIASFCSEAGGWLKEKLVGAFDSVKSALSSLASHAWDKLTSIGSKIREVCGEAISWLKDRLGGALETLRGMFSSLASHAWNALSGVASAISRIGGSIIDGAKSIASRVGGFFRGLFGGSPGGLIEESLKHGLRSIEKYMPAIEVALTAPVTPVAGATPELVSYSPQIVIEQAIVREEGDIYRLASEISSRQLWEARRRGILM